MALSSNISPMNNKGAQAAGLGGVFSKIVIIISANPEWIALKSLFPDAKIQQSPFGELFHATLNLKPSTSNLHPVIFFYGGWGKISAAASAQYVIDHFQPDLLVNLGTCGGFEGRVETGTIILVERAISYDIYEQMGDTATAVDFYATDLDLSWLPPVDNLSVRRGLIVSGDRDIHPEDIPMLIERYDAFAGDWETASIAWVAQKNGSKLLVLRGVSDLVSIDGGEAYGNKELFCERAQEIMPALLEMLEDILRS